MRPELRDRVVLPIAIPVGSLALIGVVVFFFSRVLLAVGKDLAVAIALAAAVDILVVCWILAYRRPTPAVSRLAVLVGVGVVVAGALAMRPSGTHEEEGADGAAPAAAVQPTGTTLVAKDLVFNSKQVTLKAGAQASVTMRNQDPATPHNFAVYRSSTLEEPIFKGDLVNGPSTKTYTFTAPPAGSYYFQCDVHPTTMSGAVTVT